MRESEERVQLTDMQGRVQDIWVNDVIAINFAFVGRATGAMYTGGGLGIQVKTKNKEIVHVPRSPDNDSKILDLLFAWNGEAFAQRWSNPVFPE